LSRLTSKRVPNLPSSVLKCFQLQGGFAPLDPLTRGCAPGPRWGQSPQTPTIGSRSRARHILSVPVLFLLGNEHWLYLVGAQWLGPCYISRSCECYEIIFCHLVDFNILPYFWTTCITCVVMMSALRFVLITGRWQFLVNHWCTNGNGVQEVTGVYIYQWWWTVPHWQLCDISWHYFVCLRDNSSDNYYSSVVVYRDILMYCSFVLSFGWIL